MQEIHGFTDGEFVAVGGEFGIKGKVEEDEITGQEPRLMVQFFEGSRQCLPIDVRDLFHCCSECLAIVEERQSGVCDKPSCLDAVL